MITLHCGSSTYDIQVDDTSYRYRALMAKPQLVLKFSLSEYIDIPVGAWCMFQNEKFVLRAESNLKKSGTRNITYDMTLGQDEDDLGLYKMRNSVDGRLKYSMCAKPHELIEEIVKTSIIVQETVFGVSALALMLMKRQSSSIMSILTMPCNRSPICSRPNGRLSIM